MSAIYVLSITHKILAKNWDVTVSVSPLDSDYAHWTYARDGERSFQQYEQGLAAIHGGALRKICDDLKIPFERVREEIAQAGGLLSRRDT